jgi:dethiobiotin synthetase
MGIGIFLTGTDTGVGKTAVAAALTRHLARRGLSVGVMKPVETGVCGNAREQGDAHRLATAAGTQDDMSLVAPFRFEHPLAPLAAARASSQAIDQAAILQTYRVIERRHDVTLVEGVGGLLVPIGNGWDVRDLIAELKLPSIVVGRCALGGINQARLTMEALHARHLPVLALVLNQAHSISSGREWEQMKTTGELLRELLAGPVLGPLPYVEGLAHDWLQALDLLARDSAIHVLGDLIVGIAS